MERSRFACAHTHTQILLLRILFLVLFDTHTHTHIHTHTRAHTHIHIHTHIHTHARAHTHTHTQNERRAALRTLPCVIPSLELGNTHTRARMQPAPQINFGGCWDSAAGALMVSEAGGTVLDPAGGPWDVMSRRVLAAGTRQLGEAVAAVLAGCKLSSREVGPPPAGGVVSLERQEAAAAAAAKAQE